MITQYTQYSTPPSAVVSLVSNSIGVLDRYVIMQTGQNEYTALIYNMVTKKTDKIRVYRNSGSNTYWQVARLSENSFNYTVTNEYYVYSNDGIGLPVTLPVYQGLITFSVVGLTCLAFFAVIFKGALFKCLQRKSR